jgi:hypothetical protein
LNRRGEALGQPGIRSSAEIYNPFVNTTKSVDIIQFSPYNLSALANKAAFIILGARQKEFLGEALFVLPAAHWIDFRSIPDDSPDYNVWRDIM